MGDISGDSTSIQGTWDNRFERVKDAFQLQLDRGEDVGASACVFVDGSKQQTANRKSVSCNFFIILKKRV